MCQCGTYQGLDVCHNNYLLIFVGPCQRDGGSALLLSHCPIFGRLWYFLCLQCLLIRVSQESNQSLIPLANTKGQSKAFFEATNAIVMGKCGNENLSKALCSYSIR